MEEKITKLIADEKIIEFLKSAAIRVNKLPEWKRGVLEASSRAFNDVLRKSIIGDRDGK